MIVRELRRRMSTPASLHQVAIEYLYRQTEEWDCTDQEQLIEMAGPSCCPFINQRARMSHEERRKHIRTMKHMAQAYGFTEVAMNFWLKLPEDLRAEAGNLIEMTERAGVEVTAGMLQRWVVELKRTNGRNGKGE